MIETTDLKFWWQYYNQYKTLVDKLLNEDKGLVVSNIVTLPFLYCFKHTLELGFKASIIDLGEELNEDVNSIFKKHNSKKLFRNFGTLLLKRIENVGVLEDVKTNLIEKLKNLMI